ncbi:hypothetical protein RJ640_018264 [Escallonia rubra]|uniref:Uncharacterized protein n=1 Tax=Escallonia rubra TaxID=112253 RepID=A0AA88QUV7_9ASTE|nr:hypothetical protein RJ640_018264 [Escallonia rubra]
MGEALSNCAKDCMPTCMKVNGATIDACGIACEQYCQHISGGSIFKVTLSAVPFRGIPGGNCCQRVLTTQPTEIVRPIATVCYLITAQVKIIALSHFILRSVMRDVEIPSWLKGLPLAPEFHPSDTEFADPVAYISKIEKEASAFGICKVIPPLPKPSKKYVISNLNKSLSKSPELGLDGKLKKLDDGDKGNDGEVRAVFTTRQQELGLGQSGKRTKGVVQPQPLAGHKQVWQSGEVYTLEQFESKSKAFARSQLSMVKEVSPLVIEALFWKAAFEKPIYVEYANDVPGSGFGEPEGTFRYFRRRVRRRGTFDRNNTGGSDRKNQEVDSLKHSDEEKGASAKHNPTSSVDTSKAATCSTTLSVDQTSRFPRQKGPNVNTEIEGTAGWKLSNSPWNLQVIARSPGSLTRFMPDDIPGVTSPMVYIGMLFSWFAWHVEDHELHSLNFLHTGSPKTWYAVPAAYAFSFEEVIRSQAYGGNIDRLDALTRLGEKTTLLSPEVLVSSGLPCCRLVQNPGEFVVTFPRSYHVGFSHGFSCGEAANFGTPKWLTVAKEAAVRRAAMNYLPMLSHQQLLYLLTMSFVSRFCFQDLVPLIGLEDWLAPFRGIYAAFGNAKESLFANANGFSIDPWISYD